MPSLRLKLAPWGVGVDARAGSLKLRSVPSLRLKLAPRGWGLMRADPQPQAALRAVAPLEAGTLGVGVDARAGSLKLRSVPSLRLKLAPRRVGVWVRVSMA